jgi:hypothetical protein
MRSQAWLEWQRGILRVSLTGKSIMIMTSAQRGIILKLVSIGPARVAGPVVSIVID